MAEPAKGGEKLGLLSIGDERDGPVGRHGARVGGHLLCECECAHWREVLWDVLQEHNKCVQ
eukprot:1718051-Prorocentrum_lima.AAC.1